MGTPTTDVSIREAVPSDKERLVKLRTALWPDSDPGGNAREIDAIFAKSFSTLPYIVFVAEWSDNTLAGFAEVSVRSHADGCNPAKPVGFLEGWYVSDPYRRARVGRRLVEAAENWARSQGCKEMASDTWIDDAVSQRAHEALGFKIVDRCVNFRKDL